MFIHFCSHLYLRLSSTVVGLQDVVKEVIVHWVVRNATQSTLDFILVFIIVLALRQVWPARIDKLVQYSKDSFLNYKTQKVTKKLI